MMNSQELETAVRLRLDLVVLILRDDAYGMIRWKQTAEDLPDWGLEFGNPDFVQYAKSFGAAGHRVGAAQDFVTILDQWLREGGVHVVETPIDYTETKRVLIDELAVRAFVV